MPPSINVRHIAMPRVSLSERLEHLRGLLRRGSFTFDEAVAGADRMTVAVTLFALLELYKRGEAGWEQSESFGEIAVRSAPQRSLDRTADQCRRRERARTMSAAEQPFAAPAGDEHAEALDAGAHRRGAAVPGRRAAQHRRARRRRAGR